MYSEDLERRMERQHYNEHYAMENARLDSIYIVGPCDKCGYCIKSDEYYCTTCDGHFCSEDCFEEYYNVKHCEDLEYKLTDCGRKSKTYIDTDIGTFCSVECLKKDREFEEYGERYIF